ncbi:MAG TPA: DNA recombination protein RmuC [Candidatus Bathyarchaeia archaeon]|nr:DNA recombination protein RmuC [Candidatus Bathyarchaeia archaeon]
MEIFLGIVFVLVVVGMMAVIVMLLQRLRDTQGGGSVDLIKADVTELNRTILKLSESMGDRLERNNTAIQTTVQKQLAESAKLVADVTQRLTKLDETNKRVVDVADELKTLQNVLQNPKQRGVIGEYYLEQILKNTLPPGAFALQYKLSDGLVVDAVIKYEDRLLPLDSKFSLENYNRMIEAKGEQKEALEKAFKNDIKGRIDETSKYIKPGKGTLDQALMFIPSETIYYDILTEKVGVNGRNLLQYAAEKKVTIVGPTTLAAMLQTVAQGLRSIEIHKDTEKIRKNIEQLQKHLIAHNGYMQKLGASLGTTVGHFNTTYKELGKIDRDIVKIADVEPTVEPLLLDRPVVDD